MSQENVQLVRRLIDAFNRRNFDAVVEAFDPEIEVVTLVAGTYHGHAGWRRLIDEALKDVTGLAFMRRS